MADGWMDYRRMNTTRLNMKEKIYNEFFKTKLLQNIIG